MGGPGIDVRRCALGLISSLRAHPRPPVGQPGCCATQCEPPGGPGREAASIGSTAPLGEWLGAQERGLTGLAAGLPPPPPLPDSSPCRCAASASPDRALALNLPSRPQWWWQVRSHFCPHFWPMTRACLLLPRSVLCQMGRRTWEWTPGAPRHWHLARGGPGRELSELGGDTPASWLGEAGEGPGRLEEVAPAFIIEG